MNHARRPAPSSPRTRVELGVLCLLLTGSGCASVPLVGDLGQCQQRCSREHGARVRGERSAPFADRCRCWRGDQELDGLARLNPPELDDPGDLICGRDGQTHPDWIAAAQGVKPLHAGRCGQCSNHQDIQVYRRTRHDLTAQASRCALMHLLVGRAAAERCTRAIGFSAGCADCWVDNMACTLVHCRGVCLASRLSREPHTVDGALNDCLACDERHCGAPFIRCAGVNRRRAGILSDIDRPDAQVWGR